MCVWFKRSIPDHASRPLVGQVNFDRMSRGGRRANFGSQLIAHCSLLISNLGIWKSAMNNGQPDKSNNKQRNQNQSTKSFSGLDPSAAALRWIDFVWGCLFTRPRMITIRSNPRAQPFNGVGFGTHPRGKQMNFSRFNQYKAPAPAKDSGGWFWTPHGVWNSHIPECFAHIHFSTTDVTEVPGKP